MQFLWKSHKFLQPQGNTVYVRNLTWCIQFHSLDSFLLLEQWEENLQDALQEKQTNALKQRDTKHKTYEKSDLCLEQVLI
jgi:uncharacterized protein (UPF0305 family)